MSQNAMTHPSAAAARGDEAPLSAVRTAWAGRKSRSTAIDIHERISLSSAPSSTLLVRAAVGAVFLLEGILKFVDPQGLGVGRFVKIGIPFPSFFAPFDGVFEIVCGMSLMAGLLVRLGAIPMIVNMIVAITTTKIPMLFRDGFWKAAHEARLDVTMLLGCVFLLLVGAGPLSLDSYFLASPEGRRSDSNGPRHAP